MDPSRRTAWHSQSAQFAGTPGRAKTFHKRSCAASSRRTHCRRQPLLGWMRRYTDRSCAALGRGSRSRSPRNPFHERRRRAQRLLRARTFGPTSPQPTTSPAPSWKIRRGDVSASLGDSNETLLLLRVRKHLAELGCTNRVRRPTSSPGDRKSPRRRRERACFTPVCETGTIDLDAATAVYVRPYDARQFSRQSQETKGRKVLLGDMQWKSMISFPPGRR